MTDSSPDVAIIGGGVIGCACAWALSGAGLSVTIYERGGLAGEASGASAGILAPLAESTSPGPFIELAIAGLRAFHDEIDGIAAESDIDPQYRRCGVIRLAHDRDSAAALRQTAAWQSNQALGLRWLEDDAVRALEPGLASSSGALISEDEGMVRPPLLALALATAAARRGARLREHTAALGPALDDNRVIGVQLADGTIEPAGAVLLAGGAWSERIAATTGSIVPVRPVKGQYALLRATPQPLRRVVFAGEGYVVPRVDGTLYAGATQEEAGYDRRVTVDGIASVLAMARAIVPALSDAEVIGGGAGLRPASVDGLPILGETPTIARLYIAAGHFRNGVLLSLITGQLMRDLILGHPSPISLAPFSPARHTARAALTS